MQKEPGAARQKREPVADRWHLVSNLSQTLKGVFLNKQAQLDALLQKPAETLSEEEASQLTPWYAGTALSKRQARKKHATPSGAGRTRPPDPRSVREKG
jgi:hypothetical protein